MQPAACARLMPDHIANRWYPPRSPNLPWATPHDAAVYRQLLDVALSSVRSLCIAQALLVLALGQQRVGQLRQVVDP